MNGLRGLWWWVDRWRKSSAYMDMTLEQQGAYRNLLDEANLRGGAIPDNERLLAKACGDALAWDRVKDVVMARFELREDGWHNTTLDTVLSKSTAFYQAQSLKGQRGNAIRWGHRQPIAGAIAGRVAGGIAEPIAGASPPDPDPDPDQVQDPIGTVPLAPAAPSAPKSGAVSADTLSRFKRFWDAYPAKKGKEAALKSWARLKPSEALTDTIVAAVREQTSWLEWTKEHGRYIPNPATWLNQGRWDDEPRAGGSLPLLSDVGQYNARASKEAIRILEEQDAKRGS